MDPVTHALFGASVGQLGFRRSLGRRALVYGALGALLPDIDSLGTIVLDPLAEWVHHRGVTHSIFFAPVAGTLLGGAVWRWHRRRARKRPEDATLLRLAEPERHRTWTWLFIAVLITHPLLDLFTHYGTQLLAPFSDHRFAIPALPIVDPAYTLILLASVLIGTFARRPATAVRTAAAALFAIYGYTLYGWALNEAAAGTAARQLAAEGERITRLEAYPTIFQPYWRRIVVDNGDEVLVGFHSALAPRRIEWARLRPDDGPLVEALAASRAGETLAWFADGNVLWRVRNGAGSTLVEARDLRYGLPGDSVAGFWGVRARLAPDGSFVEPPRVFHDRPRPTKENLRRMWRDIFG